MAESMKEFRYEDFGNWYKGNLHIHSTASDGGKTFEELESMYSEAGYDFLFRTDHWVASDIASESDGAPLLWMDGIELDGKDYTGASYHVVCLGTFKGLSREMGFVRGLEEARRQGAILILAHPHWMGNSLDAALRWGFHGVEIYNNVCHWLNGKSSGLVHWATMLEDNPNTLGIAVDDAHIKPAHPTWNGGWIEVNSAAKTRESILESIRNGNFYSSCGPKIHSIEFDGTTVTAKTSEIQFARLVGPSWLANRTGVFDGGSLTEVSFEVPEDWRYTYLEIEDHHGKRAWTNNLFRTTEK